MILRSREQKSSITKAVMHKNIVLFSDGTGNSVGSFFKTNVRRMYEALELADPQDPEEPRQFAFYDDGVGSSSFRPLAIVGGAIGLGLARNVRELYAFVCRTYTAGDKIYAFGFSRGAFTIRVLIGLMLSQGLVRYDGSEADLERDVADQYRVFRRNNFKGPPHVRLLRFVRDHLMFWRRHAPMMVAGPDFGSTLTGRVRRPVGYRRCLRPARRRDDPRGRQVYLAVNHARPQSKPKGQASYARSVARR